MNKYTLCCYEPMTELGETQEEIDLVNHECKHIYLGVWQNAIEMCWQFKAHLEQQGVDTTFINKELDMVSDAIDVAHHNKLITDEEFNILIDAEIGSKEEYVKEIEQWQN